MGTYGSRPESEARPPNSRLWRQDCMISTDRPEHLLTLTLNALSASFRVLFPTFTKHFKKNYRALKHQEFDSQRLRGAASASQHESRAKRIIPLRRPRFIITLERTTSYGIRGGLEYLHRIALLNTNSIFAAEVCWKYWCTKRQEENLHDQKGKPQDTKLSNATLAQFFMWQCILAEQCLHRTNIDSIISYKWTREVLLMRRNDGLQWQA